MSFGTNAPEGFVENKSKISATCNTQDEFHEIRSGYATSLYTGDPISDGANASADEGFIQQAATADGTAIRGVFKGCTFAIQTSLTGQQQFFPYWVANTVTLNGLPAQAYVIDDPFVVFTIQTGSAGAVNPPQATRLSINKNANHSYGAGGSIITGKSGAFLDMDSVGTGATKICKILSVTPGFSSVNLNVPTFNDLAQNYNNVNVIFNNHKYKGGTGTTGT
jgi:hypothetical protein